LLAPLNWHGLVGQSGQPTVRGGLPDLRRFIG
jgi:hypothetical protein